MSTSTNQIYGRGRLQGRTSTATLAVDQCPQPQPQPQAVYLTPWYRIIVRPACSVTMYVIVQAWNQTKPGDETEYPTGDKGVVVCMDYCICPTEREARAARDEYLDQIRVFREEKAHPRREDEDDALRQFVYDEQVVRQDEIDEFMRKCEAEEAAASSSIGIMEDDDDDSSDDDTGPFVTEMVHVHNPAPDSPLLEKWRRLIKKDSGMWQLSGVIERAIPKFDKYTEERTMLSCFYKDMKDEPGFFSLLEIPAIFMFIEDEFSKIKE